MWIDDDVVRQCSKDRTVNCFIPKSPLVVLGSSNDPEKEVNGTYCQATGVPVVKRYGGGGTVVLYEGCVVVSMGLWVKRWFDNQLYFSKLNQCVIDALAVKWSALQGLTQRGHSDIVWGDRKMAGTSLFRSRNYLLYQASLLVRADFDLIEKTLAHPSKEPDYRLGRNHANFLTDLSAILDSAQLTPTEVLEVMQSNIEEVLLHNLDGELITSISAQTTHLLKRAGMI